MAANIGAKAVCRLSHDNPPGFNLGAKYAFELFGTNWTRPLFQRDLCMPYFPLDLLADESAVDGPPDIARDGVRDRMRGDANALLLVVQQQRPYSCGDFFSLMPGVCEPVSIGAGTVLLCSIADAALADETEYRGVDSCCGLLFSSLSPIGGCDWFS